jgi:hypothetical protein
MSATKAREERERELVALMLFERSKFYAEYRRVMQLDVDDVVGNPCDRDILYGILAIEYPAAANRFSQVRRLPNVA